MLIKTLLDEILERENLIFELSSNNIIIKQKPESHQKISKPQGIPISGKVTDTNGLPLAGVSIIIKGTNKGTSTNSEGVFSITVIDRNSVILFSYLGFKSQELKLKINQLLIFS